jgi:hypothetical protein
LTKKVLLASSLFALAVALLPLAASTAPNAKPRSDVRVQHVGADYNAGKALPLRGANRINTGRQAMQRSVRPRAAAESTPPVGTERTWFALDDTDFVYPKTFTLRGVGDNVEVWVANDLLFPSGDCRNDERVVISDADVEYLIDEFDSNIYPVESEVFSVPPDRAGTDVNEGLAASLGLTPEEAEQFLFPGEGGRIVTFIDNVRDDNFYDTNSSQNLPYIAGFFWSFFNELADRNIMSVDAFDWLHRTRANPPHEPSTDLCESAPARPFLYEATFAHEYQHLLEYYADIDESTWMNEGLSDWAQTITGYVDPSVPITEIGYDSHIQCFLGWLGVQTPVNPNPREGGPENSLNLWGDQDFDHPTEILCDYGAAYSLMELLHDRYGSGFMTFLHSGEADGLAGLDEGLRAFKTRTTARRVLHDWAAAIAVDGALDRGKRHHDDDDGEDDDKWRDDRRGADRGHRGGRGGHHRYRIETLNAFVNWDTPETYDTPGAPPNGSDYVRLRDADGDYLKARQLRSLSFDGASVLPSLPVEWVVDSAPPDRSSNPALYSEAGDGFDRAIIRQVAVPAGSPTLTFDTKWDIELDWDYGFVQVSTDGGETWTSLANGDTDDTPDPGTLPVIHDNLPGFTGDSGGWTTQSFDLSPYAGEAILLSFRYITDSAVTLPGWWIDNVAVNGTAVSDGSSLDGWESLTQVNPVDVSGFTVQIVGYASKGKKVSVERIKLNRDFDATFERRKLRKLVHRKADVVAALVMYDEPTEQVNQYAPYGLRVNGVLQPGGS